MCNFNWVHFVFCRFFFFFYGTGDHLDLHVLTPSFPTRRSSYLLSWQEHSAVVAAIRAGDVAEANARMREHVLSGGRVYADLVASLARSGRETAGTPD